jgi:WD40 repeat protein
MESSSDSEVEPLHSDGHWLSDPPAYSTGESSLNHPLTPPPNLSIQGHTGPVNCASYSFDGKYIVSGSTDVRVWDAQTGSPVLGPLKIDRDATFWSVAFSPNGR